MLQIIKEGGVFLAPCLHTLFTFSLNSACIPSAWKTAVVSPIHKKGPRNLAEKYRPISVTSCCCRILERIIRKNLTNFLETSDLILQSQHGFRKGRSTDTLLLSFYDFVTQAIDTNNIVDTIFFDFAKAFDKIPHDILINKLALYGISGLVLRWIADFLTDRFQKVRIGNFSSASLPVSSGIIQGSVLGPLLFNLFINDIDTSLKYCSILKYADDVRIFLSAPKDDNALCVLRSKLQEDIDSISGWAAASGMDFNTAKCFCVTFGQFSKSPSRNYSLRTVSLPNMNGFDDLGVFVCSRPLSFNKHIDTCVVKAFSKLGLINKLFYFKNRNTILRLYKTYDRPKIEYTSVIWNPYTKTNIHKLDRVQRRTCMCKMIPNVL